MLNVSTPQGASELFALDCGTSTIYTTTVLERFTLKFAYASLAFLALMAATEHASARRSGIAAAGCDGCHGANGASATVTANPASFMPGAEVTLSVVITDANGAPSVGGIFVPRPELGTLYTLAGEGLTLTNDGLVHSAPKAAQGGTVTFRFGWRAPAAPGGLNLDLFVIAGNGDNRSSGDHAGTGSFRAAFGCVGQQFFYDGDADGAGNDFYAPVIGCTGQAPSHTSPTKDDCDDNNEKVFPGAKELCNTKDDDCDGQIDEDSTPVELYPDEDGDGYYARNPVGPAVMGCVGMRGYAALPGDCAPKDPKVNPGVMETCNSIDDNCDGRIDERLRPQCGVGFCRRESFNCEPENCTPGTPTAEQCNLLDDDCDGEVDEGAPCPAGQTCIAGACMVGGAASSGGAAASTGGVATGAGGVSSTTGGVNARGGAGGTTGAGASISGGAPPTSGGSSAAGGTLGTGDGGSASAGNDAAQTGGCAMAPGRRTTSALSVFGAFALFALALRRRSRS